MGYVTIYATASSDIANAGTITWTYPLGMSAGTFRGGKGHVLYVRGTQARFANVVPTFGASNITLANPGGTIPAGSVIGLQAEISGDVALSTADFAASVRGARITRGNIVRVDFGSVATAAANNICAAQAISGTNVSALVNGALATGGVATMDVPRVPLMVSANAGDTTQTVTITGTDEFGVTVRETRTLNGTTTVTFQKAFQTITSVVVSATMAGNLTVGTSRLLGLPVFIPNAANLFQAIEDGAVATIGTVVAGATATATAATGDVRGTWLPNGTANGTIQFSCHLIVPYVNDRGLPQFGG